MCIRDRLTKVRRLQRVPSESAWLADIPTAGTTTQPGTPVCSIYLKLSEPDLSATVADLIRDVSFITESQVAKCVQQIQGQIEQVEGEI